MQRMIDKLLQLKEKPCDDEIIGGEWCKMYKSCIICVLDRAIEIIKGDEEE